ncbi:MAG: protease modulator HflC [Nitrosomonas sp.]|nr:protease modulator HflC [Nitrosomonas sp.]
MKTISTTLTGLLVAVAMLGSSVIYIVDEREQAVVFQLGEVVDVKTSPGLYFKIPVVQNVRFFESRILTMDTDEPERFITSEKKNVLVDLFVKWRIVDVRQYYVSVNGDEALAQTRLSQTINSSMRDEFGNRTVHDVVSGERDVIMEIMRQKANVDARKIGVEVIDVRLKRVDLPREVSDSVYQRMEAERTRVANELRSTGAAESEKIRADADRQREVILAEAYREAQKIMGDGDGQAAGIYATAFQKDAKFYDFYRSLEAYKQSFKDKSDLLVLEPSSEFFKFLKKSSGEGK